MYLQRLQIALLRLMVLKQNTKADKLLQPFGYFFMFTVIKANISVFWAIVNKWRAQFNPKVLFLLWVDAGMLNHPSTYIHLLGIWTVRSQGPNPDHLLQALQGVSSPLLDFSIIIFFMEEPRDCLRHIRSLWVIQPIHVHLKTNPFWVELAFKSLVLAV